MDTAVDTMLMDLMKQGGYFYKHDYGRNKRSRKELKLSSDGLKLTWKSVGANEGAGTDRGSPSARGILRSASFSRGSSSTCIAFLLLTRRAAISAYLHKALQQSHPLHHQLHIYIEL